MQNDTLCCNIAKWLVYCDNAKWYLVYNEDAHQVDGSSSGRDEETGIALQDFLIDEKKLWAIIIRAILSRGKVHCLFY